MKILSISSDKTILNKDARSALRTMEYGELVEKYTVLVPAENDCEIFLSAKVNVIGAASGPGHDIPARLAGIRKIYKVADGLLQNERYDVITVQDPFENALIGWLLKRKYHIGLNIQEHGDFFSAKFWRNENFVNFVRYYLGAFLIKKADSVRAVSHRITRTLSDKFGLDETKIVTVPIFVDTDAQKTKLAYYSWREKYRGKFIFLTMGRLVKQKNLPLLISAFQKVADKYFEAMLVIVGSGPEMYKLKKMAFDLGLSNKIEFFDWTDDVYAWYATADAYVLTSNYEGWAMVVIEAAGCGLPIIMTDVGCAGEVIKDGESGVVIPVGDEEKLAAAMIRMIEDEELRKKIAGHVRSTLLTLPTKAATLDLYKKSWAMAGENCPER